MDSACGNKGSIPYFFALQAATAHHLPTAEIQGPERVHELQMLTSWGVRHPSVTDPYLAPDPLPESDIEPGTRVRVPLWRAGQVVGWVHGHVLAIRSPGTSDAFYIVRPERSGIEVGYGPWSLSRPVPESSGARPGDHARRSAVVTLIHQALPTADTAHLATLDEAGRGFHLLDAATGNGKPLSIGHARAAPARPARRAPRLRLGRGERQMPAHARHDAS